MEPFSDDESWPLCECGCGLPAPAAKYTSARIGISRGEPQRFIHGHNSRRTDPDWIEDQNGCWLWQGYLREGYGFKILENGQEIRAHRWMWEQVYGEIEDGIQIHHKCECKSCVNPSHLEAVTSVEHVRRHHKLGRSNSKSRFRGVDWVEGRQRWRTRCVINGVCHGVGFFKDEIEAAIAVQAFRDVHIPEAPMDPELKKVLVDV